jgi:hypothetical protein
MKKLLFTFFALLLTLSAMAQESTAENEAEITFQETEFNFGDIQQGEKVEHIFTFASSGLKPLIISEVITTCRCIVIEFPTNPVTKGKTANIKVVFNSYDRIGRQNKVITVISNASSSEEKVKLVGNVLAKDGQP